jgi:hypothetical protein
MSDLGGGYNGNASLKRLGVEISYTKEQIAEIVRCSEDPIYFIKNYVKIVNVDKGLIPFDMWPFQENMVNTFHNNRFCIAKMPRQVGKCLQLNTPIRLRNKRTGKIIEMTIGEFYEQQRNLSNVRTTNEGSN